MEKNLSRLLLCGQPLEAEAEGLLDINRETETYGLSLSREEALGLAHVHREALDECGRVEIGSDTVEKLALAFGGSRFLDRDNYAAVLAEATQAAYALKTESDDTTSDDELVTILADGFERFGGDLAAYVGSAELDCLLRARRTGKTEAEEPEDKDEEEEEPDE